MLRIRYRNKLRLKKVGKFMLLTLVLVLVAAVGLLAYADTLMHYDREGAHLQKPQIGETRTPESDLRVENPVVEIVKGQIAEATIQETGGIYITTSMLRDIERVTELVKEIREPCAVMIELKSIFGNFYYSSNYAGENLADADIPAIDSLIAYLRDKGFYLIASMPAFRDRAYGLENQSWGLALSSGALWEDERGCYWMDPGNDGVISHLMMLTRELAGLGFKEVCFSEFRFPDTERFVYSSDLSREEIIREAVTELCGFFVGSGMTVSFQTEETGFPADLCNGRLYIPNVGGSEVERYASAYEQSETLKELVFLANSKDTRFEERAVLRPLMTD